MEGKSSKKVIIGIDKMMDEEKENAKKVVRFQKLLNRYREKNI